MFLVRLICWSCSASQYNHCNFYDSYLRDFSSGWIIWGLVGVFRDMRDISTTRKDLSTKFFTGTKTRCSICLKFLLLLTHQMLCRFLCAFLNLSVLWWISSFLICIPPHVQPFVSVSFSENVQKYGYGSKSLPTKGSSEDHLWSSIYPSFSYCSSSSGFNGNLRKRLSLGGIPQCFQPQRRHLIPPRKGNPILLLSLPLHHVNSLNVDVICKLLHSFACQW